MATFIQVAQALNSAGPTSITYANAQAVGNLNVICIYWRVATLAVNNIFDTNGNVYFPAGPINAAQSMTTQIWYAYNINAAAANTNIVKVNFSGTVNADVVILEYKPDMITVSVDAYAIGSGNSANTINTNTFSTSSDADLLVAVARSSGGTMTGGTNFNVRIQPNGNVVEDYTTTTRSSSLTGSMGVGGGAVPWNIACAAFKFSAPLRAHILPMSF